MSLSNNEAPANDPKRGGKIPKASSKLTPPIDLDTSAIRVRDPRPLLILDLDETLIFGTEESLPDQDPITKVGPYFIHARPHVREFIDSVKRDFRLAVWTAASASYAEKVTAALFDSNTPLEFTFTDERCTKRINLESSEVTAIKDLKKVKRSRGEDLAQVLVVDDRPEGLSRNYGNLIKVRPFNGDVSDSELLKLARYLKDLADQEIDDFRRLEKRGWFHRYQD